MDALTLFGLVAVTAMLVTPWKTAATGSCCCSRCPACSVRLTASCKGLGRSAWSRRSGLWLRCGAGISGRDDIVVLLQASGKSVQRTGLMSGTTLDEERLDVRVRMAQRVDRYAAVDRTAFDHGARQQRHAHVGGDTADHAVERAELEACGRRPAELDKDLLQPLPVGAAGAESQRVRAGLGRVGAQLGERCPASRADQHQLFAERACRDEIGTRDRTCDEGGVERA